MYDFYKYYGKHKHENKTVGQPNVRHSVKKSVRFANENHSNIIMFSKEAGSDFSKTLNNILYDYFLDVELNKQRQDITDLFERL